MILTKTRAGLVFDGDENETLDVVQHELTKKSREKSEPLAIVVGITMLSEAEDYLGALEMQGFGDHPHFVIGADGQIFQTLQVDRVGALGYRSSVPAKNSIFIAVCNPGKLDGLVKGEDGTWTGVADIEGVLSTEFVTAGHVPFSREQRGALLMLVCALRAKLGDLPVTEAYTGPAFDSWGIFSCTGLPVSYETKFPADNYGATADTVVERRNGTLHSGGNNGVIFRQNESCAYGGFSVFNWDKVERI